MGPGTHLCTDDDDLWDKMQKDNCDYSMIEFNQFPSKDCMNYLDRFDNLTEKIDIYNIFKPVYPGEMTRRERNQMHLPTVAKKLKAVRGVATEFKEARKITQKDYTPWSRFASQKPLADGPTDYFNNKTVRDALHIPEGV